MPDVPGNRPQHWNCRCVIVRLDSSNLKNIKEILAVDRLEPAGISFDKMIQELKDA